MAAKSGIEVTCVVDSKSMTGEGALWDERQQCLWWVDIPAGLIQRYNPTTGENVATNFGEPVGCLAIREAGGLIAAGKTGFYEFDPLTSAKTFIADPEADMPGNRFNDGSTDRQGRFWAGTMNEEGSPDPKGSFYRLDPDRTIHKQFDGFFTTNGCTFSPDGQTFYFSDTNRGVRTIWACDYDTETGTPSNRRVFFDTRQVEGRPDGGTVDSDGCYWMAGVSGWQVVRITPAGKVDRIIDMPIESPTKPMFGGPNLDTLFVTSLRRSTEIDPAHPQAGSLFAITGLGVEGIPESRFQG